MSENTIDQQFVEYVVKSLVGNPDDVVVERTVDEKGVLLLLTVNPEDLGRVIGKRGATAQSLRTLLRALGTKQEARFNLKIVDNGVPKPQREERPPRDDSSSDDSSSSSDDTASDEPEEVEEVADEESSSAKATEDVADAPEEKEESLAEKTRKELEDLDDLDLD